MSERWDRHFLQLCLDHARMSKDPSTKVGAVIIGPDNEPRSDGFNGFPRGIADTADRLNNRDTKLGLIVHAEMNAIMTAARVGIPLKGCKLYIAALNDRGTIWGGPPCLRCSVHVIQAGITEVVTWPTNDIPTRWLDDLAAARGVLEEAGVHYREVAPL